MKIRWILTRGVKGWDKGHMAEFDQRSHVIEIIILSPFPKELLSQIRAAANPLFHLTKCLHRQEPTNDIAVAR
jgi:hypothetical protein